MSESLGEHHASHGSSKDGFSAYVLPVSILLAAVILGYSVMTAANTVVKGLDGLTLTAGSGGNALPTPDQGNLQPPTSSTRTMAELLDSGYAAKQGSDNASVVLIEYSDFQCPFCRRHDLQTYPQLVQNYVNTGKIQMVWKDFPLSFHPMAPVFANAARCAGDQGKFWEMHDKLFDEQQTLDPTGGTVFDVTADDVKAWGADLGLDTATFNACVDNNTYADEVNANFTEGAAVGVSGTPSFFVGKRGEKGQLIVGAQPYSVFQSAIDALLAS